MGFGAELCGPQSGATLSAPGSRGSFFVQHPGCLACDAGVIDLQGYVRCVR